MNEQTKSSEPKDPTQFNIIVNARQRVVSSSRLSFEEVVLLAFDSPSFANETFTVTYRRAKDDKHDGSLEQGETVKVKEGLIFNVTRTNKS